MTVYYTYADSPVGPLLLSGRSDALTGLNFTRGRKAIEPHRDWREDAAPFGDACAQLAEYFAGERQRFDVPLDPPGTRFQQSVLAALREIPYGETRSYAEVARHIGNPKAVRAVGSANGSNPIAVIIPCHRVIGSDGSLTGFGGGLPAKRFLLQLELNQTGLFAGQACQVTE